MGSFFSCCRRRKSSEREPLLPKNRIEHISPDFHRIFADIVAALAAGKLPSQTQLDQASRFALHSEILRVDDLKSDSGTLGKNWRTILKDLREVIEASAEIGLQKNVDDKIQEVIFLGKSLSSSSAHVSVSVDVQIPENSAGNLSNAAENIPSTAEVEADTKDLAKSVSKLLTLFIMSSAFRIMLQDLLISTREMIAGTAVAVGCTAEQVQIAAEKIEHLVDPKTNSAPMSQFLSSAVEAAQESSSEAFSEFQRDTADKARAAVITRFQEIFAQAKSSPEYKKAIQTILFLFRKYRNRLDEIAVSVKEELGKSDEFGILLEPQLWTDEDLSIVLADVKILLERFASNDSLDPLLRLFRGVMNDMTASLYDPEVESYFSALERWIDQTLNKEGFPISEIGRKEAESLYDKGRLLTAEDTKFGRDVRKLIEAVDSFLDHMRSDRSTQRLISALDVLSHDFTSLYQNQPQQLFEELKRDAIGWLLPRVLRTLRTIPIPRIEFINGRIEVVLDALFLTTTSTVSSMMPDHIRLENRNELYIDMSEESVRKNRFRVHVDGLRLAAKDLGYYFRYKGGFIRYTDEGLLNIYAGEKAGQGLKFDIDIESEVDTRNKQVEALFEVLEVQTSVTGLRFSIQQSRHWVLNTLLIQPFAGRVVRKIFSKIVSQYVRTALSSFAEFAAKVQIDANNSVEDGSSPSLGDYWSAILRQSETSSGDSLPEPTVRTEATLKGIVRTTQENPEASSSPHTPEESTLAVGIGPQILPDKGVVVREDNITQLARNVVSEIDETAEAVKDKARGILNAAENERSKLEETTERFKKRREAEKRRSGWRSSAFDLW